MSEEIKLPELPKVDYAGRWFGDLSMRFYGLSCYEAGVKTERERCAKIAESFATCNCNGKHGRCLENDPPNAIAAAIRKEPV